MYLLPVFFVWHGFIENYDLIPIPDAMQLTGIYCIAATIIAFLSWLYYKNSTKASLFAFLILFYHFFFGALHDFLKGHAFISYLSKYSILLPISLIIYLFLFFRIKKQSLLKTTFYLNSVLLILIAIDAFVLVQKSNSSTVIATSTTDRNFLPCDTCEHPDIFFIIADGYPGQVELTDLFNYNNSAFETELKNRGFHVTDSSVSNYNFTPFSVSSTLDMNFLTGIVGSNSNKGDMSVCYTTIKKSNTLRYLEESGYEIYNYSIFDLKGQPSLAIPTFLPRKTLPITSQTFLSRIEKELGHHLVTDLKITSVINYLKNQDLNNNRSIYTKTIATATTPSNKPKFVYTHLVMPHYPYYYDSTGKLVDYDSLNNAFYQNKNAFISYLKYSNQQFIRLIDTIQSSTAKQSVVIFMSDHGFREFSEPVDANYHFYNINAVFFPNQQYAAYYTGMSNVNQFRVVFNTLFGQQLPLLKDSTSFLQE